MQHYMLHSAFSFVSKYKLSRRRDKMYTGLTLTFGGKSNIKCNMETEFVECPVCRKRFPHTTINSHVNVCLNDEECGIDTWDTELTSRKRKKQPKQSGWGFLMCGERSTTSKKMKLSTDKKMFASDKKLPDDNSVITIDDSDCNTGTDGNDSTCYVEKASFNSTSNDQGSKSDVTCQSLVTKHTSLKGENDKEKQIHVELSVPLAEQMRPSSFENYVGQDKALGKDKMLWALLQSDSVPSMILWGPPGCGKTTLAKIVAKRCKGKSKFVQLSATSSGVNDVKEVIKNAKNDFKMFKRRTILFLDEIHRFNKLQQDSLLPHVEDGTITLIGATTENPSFQVNTALLSRCRVIVLDKLDNEAIYAILTKAAEKLLLKIVEQGSSCSEDTSGVLIEKEALEFLSAVCDGDARAALNGLQMTVQSQVAKSGQSESILNSELGENSNMTACIKISTENVKEGLQRSHIAYDKTGEEHYNTISALHKSMRGSSDSAALYWLARMMEGGEEPLYIARRLIEFASEDVGLADPQALMLAVSTYQACHFLGRPECEKPLAECVVYLSRAPKSVEAFNAYSKAKACIHNHQGPLPGVPLHLRNAPTKLMKNIGLADPQALMLAVSTYQACHFLGRPECEKPLAECVVYLSRAPKSVEAFNAYSKAKACIHNHQGPLPGVPLHLRNAPTKLMKNIGYGKGYKYNPAIKGQVNQEYFPECLIGTNFFK